MKPTNKKIKILLAIAAFFCIAGMVIILRSIFIFKREKALETELSAWIVDWQWEEGIEDLKKTGDGISHIQIFAAYLDDNGRIYFTDDALQALQHIDEIRQGINSGSVGITLVNDRFNRDGSVIHKDPAIVAKLLATPESRRRHIEEILNIVDRHDLSGIEIDYENINNDDWSHVKNFYSELYKQLRRKGKFLRIVLEPDAPIEEQMYPKGPVYIMMAYNMYGTHSGPGPKADPPFISKLAGKFNQVPGDKYMAIAAGGFDWSETGKVTSLTEKQAVELAKKYRALPVRDKNSGSLYFHYVDGNNSAHTVWYGDEVTLSNWISAARLAGYHRIALWRLGGLGEVTLELLRLRGNKK
jgi:spore germination protein YaaH